MSPLTIDNLLAGLKAHDRRSIAKCITLVESTKQKDADVADKLLLKLMPLTGKALRIGISGIPGVGKSTFIEALGMMLIKKGLKVAVLAVDPSSPLSGGSIMGDKTRMENLAAEDNTFIRPSPAGETLGGVARKTRESALVLDAAGYEIILIETVGVGQSEVVVSSMVDAFLILQMPSTGDELQSIKKGILEMADVIAINKADGALALEASSAVATHQRALQLVKTHVRWTPPVIPCSSTEQKGISKVWEEIENFIAYMKKENKFDARRAKQNADWFDSEVNELFLDYIHQDKQKSQALQEMKEQVISGEIPATSAARAAIKKIIQ